jgi:hypothetical protein
MLNRNDFSFLFFIYRSTFIDNGHTKSHKESHSKYKVGNKRSKCLTKMKKHSVSHTGESLCFLCAIYITFLIHL